MSILKTKKFSVKAAVLTAVGLALSVVVGIRRQSGTMLWIADMLFAEGTVFLVAGLIGTLGNMHAFTSASWGFRQVHRIFKQEKLDPDKEKESYVAYRSSRPHHADARALLLIGLVLMALSAVVSLTLVH